MQYRVVRGRIKIGKTLYLPGHTFDGDLLSERRRGQYLNLGHIALAEDQRKKPGRKKGAKKKTKAEPAKTEQDEAQGA